MNGLEKKIAAELAAANALEEKYNDQPRSGWVKPGSRVRSNQAISVSRQEVVALARDHHAATPYAAIRRKEPGCNHMPKLRRSVSHGVVTRGMSLLCSRKESLGAT